MPRLQINPRVRDVLLAQLSQKSTVVAIGNAVALLVGWNLAPEKLDALGFLLSIADTAVLAIVQERTGPVTTTTVVSDPPGPPVVVSTTTDDTPAADK